LEGLETAREPAHYAPFRKKAFQPNPKARQKNLK